MSFLGKCPHVANFDCNLIQNNSLSAEELNLPHSLRSSILPKHFFLINVQLSGHDGCPTPKHVSLVPSSARGLTTATKEANVVYFTVDGNPEFFASLPSEDPTSGPYSDLTVPLPMSKANRILCELYDITTDCPDVYAEAQATVISEILRDLSLNEADLNDVITSFSKRMPRMNRGSQPKRNVVGAMKPPTLWNSHDNCLSGCDCEIILEQTEYALDPLSAGSWSATYSGIVACPSLTKQLAGLQKNVLGRSIRNSKIFAQQVITGMSWSLPGTTEVTSTPMSLGSDLYEVLPPKRAATKRKRASSMEELNSCKKRASELEAENTKLKALFHRLMGLGAWELDRVLAGSPKPQTITLNEGEIVVQGCNLVGPDPVSISLQVSSLVEPLVVANDRKPFSFAVGFDQRLHPDNLVPLRVASVSAGLPGQPDEVRAQLPSLNELPSSWLVLFSGNSLNTQVIVHRKGEGFMDPAHSILLTCPPAPACVEMSDEDSSTDRSTADEEQVFDEEPTDFSTIDFPSFTGSFGL